MNLTSLGLLLGLSAPTIAVAQAATPLGTLLLPPATVSVITPGSILVGQVPLPMGSFVTITPGPPFESGATIVPAQLVTPMDPAQFLPEFSVQLIVPGVSQQPGTIGALSGFVRVVLPPGG